jgi:protein O-GlcNAc transferase
MNRVSAMFAVAIQLFRVNFGATGWKLLLVTFLVFAPSVASAQNPAQELSEIKQHAQTSLAGGQYTEAIAEYQEWLQLQPKSVEASLGLAQGYRGVHNYDEAWRILELARSGHPGNADAPAALGDLDIEMQSYDKAIRHLSAALVLRPNGLETRNRLAIAYKAKGDSANALAQIAKILTRDAKNALAYYTRAQIESDQNRDGQALLDAEKVAALQPKNALGSILLAKILLRDRPGTSEADARKKCSRAVQLLEPLFPAHAGDSGTLYLLSRAYDCAGQPEKAKQTLADFEAASRNDRTTKENQTQAKHLVEQANAVAQKNDFPGALDLLQQALAKDPKYGAANSQLAKIYYSEGDLEKADDAIGQALQSDPYQPDFLYVQGKILEKEGNPDQALAAFQQTTLVNPRESDAYFEMGVIYQQKNDREHALGAYKKAVELSPDDPDYKRAVANIQ